MNMMNNVLDMMKMDHQTTSIINGNVSTFKNGMESCVNDLSSQKNTANVTAPSLETLMNSRNLSNQLLGNSSLPLGAQIFTIPASLATFPNSDLIPVFINSLGQMVLANTGNLLANSLASLATTLTSLQQLSTNCDQGMFGSNQSLLQNNGIMEHLMQQYQQIQMMKNSAIQQNWPSPFQPTPRVPTPTFLVQSIQPTVQTHTHTEISDKTIQPSILPMPTSCSSSSLPSDKFHSTNVPSTEYRQNENKSPSVTSSTSSRSVGNKINQMIDVSNDYILGQEDHLVKEKAAEMMRQSYSHQTFNSNFNESNQCIDSIGFNSIAGINKSGDMNNEVSKNIQNMTVDGVDIGEIREFARNFKMKRLSIGLTQTQVGQALTAAEGPAYSQSAICRFEKLDITPKSAQKIKPILEKWIKESEEKFRNGDNSVEEGSGSDINKKRKRRTSFTPQALEVLNVHFDKKSHPTGSEMRTLANELNYDREVIRVWFCNKRQALKNSIKRVKQSPGSEMIVPAMSTADSCIREYNCDNSNNNLLLTMKQKGEALSGEQSMDQSDSLKVEAEDLSIERKGNDIKISERVMTLQTETAF